MSFAQFWTDLQTNIKSGATIKNWTAAKGYLGDEFKVLSVAENRITIETPEAENIQNVSKKEFEVMYNNWDAYCSKQIQRKELTKLTRFSKYTMSIIKHLENVLENPD